MYPKKFSLSFIFLYPLCAVSISLSLSFCCSFHNSIKHTYSFCVPFFLPFCLLLFLLLLCVRVCVIYIISLLQKFTLIVGTIFWHFGFTTLRAVCVVVAVAVFDNFFVVVEPYVKLVSLPLSLPLCVCLTHSFPRIPFQQPTAHFTISAFGNICAFRLSVCPSLLSFLSC